MKMFTSLPGNTEFYHRYAGIIPTLHRSGYLAQVISFMTEIGILYSILYQSLIDFVPDYAESVATVGAFVGAGFIEVGLRKFLPYSVRQTLNKRFSGLDLVMTIFIFSGTILLIGTSGILSFKGSKDLVEWAAPPPVKETSVEADSIAQAAELDAMTTYQKDSLATAEEYAAKILAAKTKLKGYEDREARTGRSYATRKQSVVEQISGLESEAAAALASVWRDHKNALDNIEAERTSSVKEIKDGNQQREDKAATKVANYGGGLGWFTIVCLAVLIISVILHEVYRKGSAIEEKARPSQYAFLPPVWLEAVEAFQDRVSYSLRSRITAFSDATPPPPLPAAVKSLYDQSNIAIPGVTVESEAHDGSVIRLPVQRLTNNSKPAETGETPDAANLAAQAINYTAAAVKLEDANLHDQAAEMYLKAEQVLKLYLGPNGTDDDVASWKEACIKHLNGDGPNPFGHHHRQPIGFHTATENDGRYNGPVSTAKIVVDSSLKNCAHCDETFKPKAWNQRYCSTDCKTAFHAVKHGGQTFEPHKFHGRKR